MKFDAQWILIVLTVEAKESVRIINPESKHNIPMEILFPSLKFYFNLYFHVSSQFINLFLYTLLLTHHNLA